MGKRVNVAKWIDKYKRWQINVQKDGVRRSFYSSVPGRTGQRECHSKADAWLDDNMKKSNCKVSVLFTDWVTELKLTTSRGHWTNYDSFGRNWILPRLGKKKISAVTEQDFQNIINDAFKKGLSKKTLSNLRACIAAFIKYCRKTRATKLIIENVYIPKGAPKSQKNILQPDDLRILFSSGKTKLNGREVDELFINAYRFEVATGLRPGEALGLKKSDIKSNHVRLQRSINKYGEITTGKNDNARRDFVLTKQAVSILRDQLDLLSRLQIVSDYVFADKYGEPIKQSNYYKRWVKYRTYNKISAVSPYELRHTFISVVKTLPPGLLKPLVGHSEDMDTFGVYSHDVTGDKDLTAKLVEQTFERILK